MSKIKIGKTGLTVERNAFGALPIQRVDMNEAVYLLQKAQDGGMEYFDTALVYSDSEEKMGEAFKDGRREKIIIATKTPSDNVEGFWQDLETSLKSLRTDYIDVYQFHNPEFCPLPGGEDGLYDAMIEARRQGKIRFIGITEHRLKIAREAIACGAYDTLQFPFSYIGGEQERALVKGCEDAGIGFICMLRRRTAPNRRTAASTATSSGTASMLTSRQANRFFSPAINSNQDAAGLHSPNQYRLMSSENTKTIRWGCTGRK